MKSYLECIPCFLKQAIEASRISGANERTTKRIVDKICREIIKFPFSSSPPEMGIIVYGLIAKITKVKDPYKGLKRKSNLEALKLLDNLKRKICDSRDPLFKALEFAIAGNIIDYGVKNTLNVDKELKKILSEENRVIKNEKKGLFRYDEFKKKLKGAREILFLADNAGEVVFDRLLLEEIKRRYRNKKIFYAVKEKPIINDALIEDAYMCGIDKSAAIISSGSIAPGTILSRCSKEFLKIYKSSDLIVSKGQGNFETLSDEKGPIFFLFMAKCPVVAKHLNCNLGDIILTTRRAYNG